MIIPLIDRERRTIKDCNNHTTRPCFTRPKIWPPQLPLSSTVPAPSMLCRCSHIFVSHTEATVEHLPAFRYAAGKNASKSSWKPKKVIFTRVLTDTWWSWSKTNYFQNVSHYTCECQSADVNTRAVRSDIRQPDISYCHCQLGSYWRHFFLSSKARCSVTCVNCILEAQLLTDWQL